MKKLIILFFAALLTMFSSCFARIDGTIEEGGAAVFNIRTSLGPSTSVLIRSLGVGLGMAEGGLILDGHEISESMALAPGISSVILQNTDPFALEGSISVSRVGDFLRSGGSETGFISFSEGAASSSMVINMSLESAPALISAFSPEAEAYLEALMAPAVTGEVLNKREYISLVSSIYGRDIAEEISEARIMVYIQFPRQIRSVLGGQFSGRQAQFDIPLLDLLVLEEPLRYEVNW